MIRTIIHGIRNIIHRIKLIIKYKSFFRRLSKCLDALEFYNYLRNLVEVK